MWCSSETNKTRSCGWVSLQTSRGVQLLSKIGRTSVNAGTPLPHPVPSSPKWQRECHSALCYAEGFRGTTDVLSTDENDISVDTQRNAEVHETSPSRTKH